MENRFAEIEALKGTTKYTWGGIIDFLQEQQHSVVEKETEWILEKQELQSKVASLEGEIKAQENINKDLRKRIQVIEYAMQQERSKKGKLIFEENKELLDEKHNLDSEEPEESIYKENIIEEEVKMAQKRSQKRKEMLKKFLDELGIDDILADKK